MGRTSRIAVAVCALLALLAGSGRAEAPDSVGACLKRNLPERTSVQTIELRARDRIGAERSLRGKIWWKRFEDGFSRVIARFSEPPQIAGAGILLIGREGGNDLFLYMPEVKKVRRVTSQMMKGTLFGTDFSYEDLERLQGMGGRSETERLPDAEIEGRRVQVLAARPQADSGSSYTRAVTYIEPETCVLLKVELFEAGDRLRKVLTADPAKVTREKNIYVPREIVMRDLRDETQTTLVVHDVQVGASIPDRSFSFVALERGREP